MSEERGFKTYCSPDVLFVMNSCLFFEIWESVLQSNYIFHVPEQAMCGWRCATPTNDLNTEAQMYALRGTVNVAVSPVSLACGCIKYGWRIWGLVSLQACSPPTCNTCLLAYLMLLDAGHLLAATSASRPLHQTLHKGVCLVQSWGEWQSSQLDPHAKNVILCSGVFGQIKLHKHSRYVTAKCISH